MQYRHVLALYPTTCEAMTGPKYRRPAKPHMLVAVDLGKRKIGISVGRVSATGKTRMRGAYTLHAKPGRW